MKKVLLNNMYKEKFTQIINGYAEVNDDLEWLPESTQILTKLAAIEEICFDIEDMREAWNKLMSIKVMHPINAEGKENKKVTYCFKCGTYVRNQLYCHGCGYKLDWSEVQ